MAGYLRRPPFHLRSFYQPFMSTTLAEFSPGALVRARGREWVVQPGSVMDALSLRPLGGSEEDIALILPDLELEPPAAAVFPWPDPTRHGSHQSATLLRDAPDRLWRRLGGIAFEDIGLGSLPTGRLLSIS